MCRAFLGGDILPVSLLFDEPSYSKLNVQLILFALLPVFFFFFFFFFFFGGGGALFVLLKTWRFQQGNQCFFSKMIEVSLHLHM